jgi:hypothetical protein
MESHMTCGPKLALFAVPFLFFGCPSFGPTTSELPDSGMTSSTLMSCDGTTINPDPFCAGGARVGSPCTKDCCFPASTPTSCGIGHLGATACTCPNGIYDVCTCVPPPSWPTLPAGGDCVPKGTSAAAPTGLSGVSCSREWTTCWTSEVAGNRGCICLKDPTTGNLNLQCGNPLTWFMHTRGTTTAY